jgi:transposase InsO family protein
MDEKQREEVGVFRYGVICELVNRPVAKGGKEALMQRLASRDWTIPGTTRTRLGRSTIRDWVALYEAMGLEGLKPPVRGDVGESRAIPEDVQDLLLAMRRERPKAPVDSLVRAVRLSGRVDPRLKLARTTVYRLLATHGLPTGVAVTEPDALAFTYPHVNDLWTSDVMHGPRLVVPGRRDGGKTYLMAFLDDASRMVPYAAFYPAENAACFQHAFQQALLRRGVARCLYVDNGSTFRTHHLQVICATLNISLVHSRPHKPRGRGKIERFFRHVRSAFLPHVTAAMLADLASLNRVFWAWLEAEYHHTPKRSLDGKTPLERFLIDEALVRPAPDGLEALMRMKVTRKVARDRTVRLAGLVYEAPDGWADETIEVNYDPYDPLRPVHAKRRGEDAEVRLHRLDGVTNAVLRRVPREDVAPEVVPPTGISYLDLVAKGFYGEDK